MVNTTTKPMAKNARDRPPCHTPAAMENTAEKVTPSNCPHTFLWPVKQNTYKNLWKIPSH